MKVGSLVLTTLDFRRHLDLAHSLGMALSIKKYPIKGNIYTVREIQPDLPGGIGLLLEEIVNGPDKKGEEHAFGIVGFREIQPPIDVEAIVEDAISTTQVKELQDA